MPHNPYSNLPTNSDTVTFQYDASGRRLKKTYTSHITIDGTPHTDVTTYKYHYAGGVITEIELDKVRDSTTTLLDQELIYHIGANSQPISFEWTRHTGTGESQTTTTSTYYYHYDVHGNTLKVTDTNQDTKITYTYDTLGNITSQTNPDSIPNPFTFMGASQTILDTETNLYFSSGYYNPQTGTLLQGTGSPAMPNPTSISTINSMSTSSLPEDQLLSHSITSATTAGSSSGGEPGSFAPPAGPSDGISHSGRQSGPPSLDFSNPDAELVGAKDVGEKNINGIICTNGSAEDGGDILKRNSENLGFTFDGNGGETWKEYEERKKFMEDLRDGQIVSDEGSIHKVSEMPILLPMKGILDTFAEMIEEMNDILDDKDKKNDGKQYKWVVRDSNGNITACCTKDDEVYIFETNSNGERTGTINLFADNWTYSPEAGKAMAKSWKNICSSIGSKDSEINFFNEAHFKTSGSVGMCVRSDGMWVGVFVDKDGTYVKEGRCAEFGNDDAPKKYQGENGEVNIVERNLVGTMVYRFYSGGKMRGNLHEFMKTKSDSGKIVIIRGFGKSEEINYNLWDEKSLKWDIDHLASW